METSPGGGEGREELTRSGIGYHMVSSFQQVWTNKDCMCFLHIAWSGNKIKQNYSSVTHSHTSVQWGSRYNGGHCLQRWLMILHQLLMLCLCGLLYTRVHSISMKMPLLVPIGPVSKSTHCLSHCKLRVPQSTNVNGMTVGVDEGFWYVVLHPEKYEFEVRNLGTLLGALFANSKISRWKKFRYWFCILWGCSIKWWQIKAGKHTHYPGKRNRYA